MIVWGMPREVKRFFLQPVANCSKSIRHTLASMDLAFLLAPHRRCLKTIAGEVLGQRGRRPRRLGAYSAHSVVVTTAGSDE